VTREPGDIGGADRFTEQNRAYPTSRQKEKKKEQKKDASSKQPRECYRRSMKLIWGTLVAAISCTLLHACSVQVHAGNIEEEKLKAAIAMTKFHAHLDAGEFDKIIDESSAAMQRSAPRDVALQALKQMHQKYGHFVRSTAVTMNVLPGPPVEVRAVCSSDFEKGPTTEMLSLVDEDGAVKLQLFRISPGTVMSKDAGSAH
jgi:hypothetical protein